MSFVLNLHLELQPASDQACFSLRTAGVDSVLALTQMKKHFYCLTRILEPEPDRTDFIPPLSVFLHYSSPSRWGAIDVHSDAEDIQPFFMLNVTIKHSARHQRASQRKGKDKKKSKTFWSLKGRIIHS